MDKIDKILSWGTETFIEHPICTRHCVEAVKINIVPAFKFFIKKQIQTYSHNPEMLQANIALERGLGGGGFAWQIYHKKSKENMTEKNVFQLIR